VVFHLQAMLPGLVERVQALPAIKNVQAVENRLLVSLDDPDAQNPAIVRTLVEGGAGVQFVGELRHSLEDIYLEMIRQEEAQ